MNGGRSAEAHTSASDRERRLPVSFRWRRLVILLTRARRPRTQAVRERAPCPVMGHTAVCGRDARAPRRASHPHEATQGTMPAHPGGVTLLSAGETPAHPGGARTRTMSRDGSHCCLRARRPHSQAVRGHTPHPARQEHPGTTARHPGRNASY
jgi:hypothetical protein